MNDDPIENARREMQAVANQTTDDDIPHPRWDTAQLQQDFEVIGFAAPFVIVRRRSDGKKGSLMFRHHPRVYYNWEEA